jgi:serine/threonine-protein kinase
MDGPESAASELRAGELFGDRYEIVRRIGAGGMGAIYEVIHLETRRRRALKVMLPSAVADATLRERFRLEATVAADIESQHIVETFDAGIDEVSGAPFLVMELLRGHNLADLLSDRGRFEASEVVALLAQAAHALDRTHAAGIVHRDLKPDNLFVTRRDDGTPHLKILDFGIAKVVAQSRAVSKTSGSIGTPLYMSPEQISGSDVGPSSDLYALGHIAYTMLVGQAYFEPDAKDVGLYAVLVRVMKGAQQPASARAVQMGVELPPAFDEWFARATALLAEDRFDRAADLVTALAAALEVAAPAMATGSVRDPSPSLANNTEVVVDSRTDPQAATTPVPPPRTPVPPEASKRLAATTTSAVSGEQARSPAIANSRAGAAMWFAAGAFAIVAILTVGRSLVSPSRAPAVAPVDRSATPSSAVAAPSANAAVSSSSTAAASSTASAVASTSASAATSSNATASDSPGASAVASSGAPASGDRPRPARLPVPSVPSSRPVDFPTIE